MDDLKWLAVVAILTLVSLAYIALLSAGEETGS